MGRGKVLRLLFYVVELEDFPFRTVKERPPSGSIKPGRGSQQRSNVLVGCESVKANMEGSATTIACAYLIG
ncbi:MAG: hypothetical protein H6603_08115 [Flavobacteriales bacterium]|nr:hypothetical protein [Flavobacteriales bacterium]